MIEKDDTCLIQTLSGKLKIERTAISLEMSSKVNISSTKKKLIQSDFFYIIDI